MFNILNGKTQTRTVIYNNIVISYELTRKKVKNINLRIHSDCTITISANNRVSLKKIDEFVLNNGEFIIKHLDKFSTIKKETDEIKQYLDGDIFRVFDTKLELKTVQDMKNYVDFDEENIYLHIKNINDFDKKQNLVDEFLNQQCKLKLTKMTAVYFPMFSKYNISMPELKFRSMTSRWGSCRPAKCSITLNTNLINKSLGAAEYVVVHELAHLVEANHSKQFYAVVEDILPDWKKRKSELNI